MSRSQTIWCILWEYAAKNPGPFEIDEVVPEVVAQLLLDAHEACRRTAFLLGELDRLRDGHQFFFREGNAVVPLPEYEEARQKGVAASEAYPFED